MNYAGLKLGRITLAGKEHVCASYSIHDALGDRWNKKYMIVLGGMENALTATCSSPEWFAQRADGIESELGFLTGRTRCNAARYKTEQPEAPVLHLHAKETLTGRSSVDCHCWLLLHASWRLMLCWLCLPAAAGAVRGSSNSSNAWGLRMNEPGWKLHSSWLSGESSQRLHRLLGSHELRKLIGADSIARPGL